MVDLDAFDRFFEGNAVETLVSFQVRAERKSQNGIDHFHVGISLNGFESIEDEDASVWIDTIGEKKTNSQNSHLGVLLFRRYRVRLTSCALVLCLLPCKRRFVWKKLSWRCFLVEHVPGYSDSSKAFVIEMRSFTTTFLSCSISYKHLLKF